MELRRGDSTDQGQSPRPGIGCQLKWCVHHYSLSLHRFICGVGGGGKGGLTPSRNGTFLFVIRAKRTICPQKDAVLLGSLQQRTIYTGQGLLSRIMVLLEIFPKGRRPFGGKWFFWKSSHKDGVLLGQMVLFVFMKDHFFWVYALSCKFTAKGFYYS